MAWTPLNSTLKSSWLRMIRSLGQLKIDRDIERAQFVKIEAIVLAGTMQDQADKCSLCELVVVNGNMSGKHCRDGRAP